MLQVIKWLLSLTATLISNLFKIDLGFTNLGTLLCIINILLPMMLIIVGFAKNEALTLFAKEYYEDEKGRSKKK